jgi:hypothetical protein
MNLNEMKYINEYLAAPPGQKAINDAAEKYGVTIWEAQVADGQLYWRVIGVHHLLGPENQRSHNILVEALDEEGRVLRQGRAYAASTWEGRHDGPDVKALDKGTSDPMGCDFPMGKEATYSVWMKGKEKSSDDPSDRVEKLHTRHADEGPDNTIGHHSFFVVFRRTLKGPTVLDEKAVLAAARRLRDEQSAGDEPFAVYARRNGLGAPVTAELSAGGFRARGYERGIIYAPLARPDDVKHMAW